MVPSPTPASSAANSPRRTVIRPPANAPLNAIAQLKAATGDLEKIQKIVRIEGYVHCADGFRGHPQVLNGASDLVAELFGERGQHTRLALGINEMPLNAAVQLAMTAEVAD